MHPALSVILFTSLSGAGYGLLVLLGLDLALASSVLPISMRLYALLLGIGLTSIGLLCSVGHLGKPLRAWRAVSQWRTSWLSREGLLALLLLLPAALLGWELWNGQHGPLMRGAAAVVAVLAAGCVYATAGIYFSLKPIAAWHNRFVAPVYLGFALLGGGLLAATLVAAGGTPTGPAAAISLALLAIALGLLKLAYWRHIDDAGLAGSTASAVGLPRGSVVSAFERPHTEANYLLKEMGYVLARRHVPRLRVACVLLAFAVPLVALALGMWWWGWLLLAVASHLLGAVVERWLFFAQARHAVMHYYPDPGAPVVHRSFGSRH